MQPDTDLLSTCRFFGTIQKSVSAAHPFWCRFPFQQKHFISCKILTYEAPKLHTLQIILLFLYIPLVCSLLTFFWGFQCLFTGSSSFFPLPLKGFPTILSFHGSFLWHTKVHQLSLYKEVCFQLHNVLQYANECMTDIMALSIHLRKGIATFITKICQKFRWVVGAENLFNEILTSVGV